MKNLYEVYFDAPACSGRIIKNWDRMEEPCPGMSLCAEYDTEEEAHAHLEKLKEGYRNNEVSL